MIRYTLFLICLVGFAACTFTDRMVGDDIIYLPSGKDSIIFLDDLTVHSDNIRLDSLIDENSFCIIPLETSESSLFAVVSKLDLFEGKLVVSDFVYDKVLIFDEKGFFERQVASIGKGPGEPRANA